MKEGGKERLQCTDNDRTAIEKKSSNLLLSFFSHSSIDQAKSLLNYLTIINYTKKKEWKRRRRREIL